MKSKFEFTFLEQSTEVLRAIAHPIRLSIIDLLFEHEQMTVSEIHEQLDIEQAVASHHLRILKDKKVVKSKREGKNSYYSLENPIYFQIVSTMVDAIG